MTITNDAANSNSLILGTAQWGLDYGVSNKNGKLIPSEIKKIKDIALDSNINMLDTAPVYGNSEELIGEYCAQDFKIITKIPKLSNEKDTKAKVELINKSFYKSISNLKIKKAHALLFHSADDLILDRGHSILECVKALQEKNLVSKIGLSIYDSSQIDSILDFFLPDIIQVPISLLDQRLIHSGHLVKLKQAGVEIHARSIYLQGLLHMSIDKMDDFFSPIKKLLVKMQNDISKENLTINQAALLFVKGIKEIDKIIIGVDSSSQLHQAVNDIAINRNFYAKDLFCSQKEFIDPSRWKLSERY